MGKYAAKKTASGFMFSLKAGNGEVIGRSEVYTTLNACRNGIASVTRNAPVANLEDQTQEGYERVKHPKFEVYLDKKQEYRFRLKATNGEIILSSEGYTNKSGCLNGIESVRKNSGSDTEMVED